MGETVKLKRTLMRMRLPGKLMFLFRIRFGFYAVLARIGAELDWAALEDELAGDLGRIRSSQSRPGCGQRRGDAEASRGDAPGSDANDRERGDARNAEP
jgi:hypothetical protein